jgi:hypothetical protein
MKHIFLMFILLLNMKPANANFLGDFAEFLGNTVKAVVEVPVNILTNPSDPLKNPKKTFKYGIKKLESAGNKIGKSGEDFICGLGAGSKCNINLDFSAGTDGVQLGNQEPGYKEHIASKGKDVTFEQSFQEYHNDYLRRQEEIRDVIESNPDIELSPDIVPSSDLALISLENAKYYQEKGDMEAAQASLENFEFLNSFDEYSEEVEGELLARLELEEDKYFGREPANDVFDGSLSDLNDLDGKNGGFVGGVPSRGGMNAGKSSGAKSSKGASAKGKSSGKAASSKSVSPDKVCKETGVIYDKPKIENQMKQRGWTRQDVADVIKNPYATRRGYDVSHDSKGGKNTGMTTTYYRQDGNSVVVNRATNKLIHITNINKPGWNDTASGLTTKQIQGHFNDNR